MVITYRSEKSMTLVDRLSRLPNKRVKETIDPDIKVNFVQFSTEKLARLQALT